MTITNLFGEKVPRVAALPWSPAEVEVKVANKTEITVIGADREKVDKQLPISKGLAELRKEIDVFSKMEFTLYQRGMSEEGFEWITIA